MMNRPTSSNNKHYNLQYRPLSHKTNITFSYAPPKIQIENINSLTRVQSALPLLQPEYSEFKQKFQQIQNVQVRDHISVVDAERSKPTRKKIFENRSSRQLGIFSTYKSQKQNSSLQMSYNRDFSHNYTHNQNARKRKLIFDLDQRVKSNSTTKVLQKSNTFLTNNTFLPNNTFPIILPTPKHPKNLVEYINLTPRRKNRSISPLQPVKQAVVPECKQTYQISVNKNIIQKSMNDNSEILPRKIHFERTPSATYISPEEESVISYSHHETNRSSDDLRELLQQTEGQRFYDNQQQTKVQVEKLMNYTDIRMAQSTGSGDWKAITKYKQSQSSGVPHVVNSSFLKKRFQQIYYEVAHHRFTFPIMLIVFGVLLLVIQSLK